MISAPPQSNLSREIVASVLNRLGHWESSVDRPHWTDDRQLRNPFEPGDTPFVEHRDAPEQVVRFLDCQPERQFWLDLLPNIDPNIRRIDRFRDCGAYAYVIQNLETGRYYLQGAACKLRICPVCRKRLQRRSVRRVLDFMTSNPNLEWQFHTFTLKHSSDPLPDQLNRLVASFRKLRHRKLWKTSVTTGYAVIEVTFHPAGSWSPNGRQRTADEWHPHLHVLAATSFIDWGALRRAWLAVTGDSDNIECSLVESPAHAAHYVAKYIGKPPDLDLASRPDRASEYYFALQSRRLLQPFGVTINHKPPPPEPPAPSRLICRYDDLKEAAVRGSYPASCVLAHLILTTVPSARPRSRPDPSLWPQTPT